MRQLSRIPEALVSGLYLALLAPLLASPVFMLLMAVGSSGPADRPDPGFLNIVFLAIGVASGAYLLGALPAFSAGVLLPTLRRRFSSFVASVSAALVAVAVYLATFGAQLLTAPKPLTSVLPLAVPAFIGTAIAAYSWTRRVGVRTSARQV